MNTKWIIETHGDPLGALRRFVGAVWRQSQLDGLLAPLDGAETTNARPRVLDDPGQLDQVNPFKPLMAMNAARLVPRLLREEPRARLGALLRPCEVRALIEMVKHDSFRLDRLLMICVDCLATLPAGEYRWRAARKRSPNGLTREALQFARQGGIVPYRFRPACQMCDSPEARGGDLNIGVLGLPVRRAMLVEARDAATAERLHLAAITGGPADPALVRQRERLLAKVAERHERAREQLIRSLAGALPGSVDEVAALLEECDVCRACLEVCPICCIDRPRRTESGVFLREDVARWLVSCAGCGMCEQACPKHLPLTAIFGHIREQLAEAAGYTPGRSVEEPVPLA